MAQGTNLPKVVLYASAACLLLVAGLAFMLSSSSHHPSSAHSHGAFSGGHDERTMPGLVGENASPEESEEMRVLFRKFDTLSREVTNLPNGIRTVTRSSDPDVMEALVSHVIGMIDRVDTGEDPKVIIQSPTLDVFFLKADLIETSIDVADEGIVVIQTSADAEMINALQTHAAEVTDMVERGMQAVHDRLDGH
ncbi:hypothetical protein [Sulfitobacter donghicola]|uniref:Uncharacterized protein n=1 Tax=Sulfitobacter donghicola DSW-25 = KCTC 12864 = JCM 14565 TaxID=1300350 RepID=A0A073IUR2_9RHOB|nr:hypothetical protein [Sulfitobacter donghicola]KEJ89122.1 hypothetical protein DSW25_12930 [Sulfitobacter donghicola DSW-25 = KCTC 12864 = JCM 14565]KIN67301.1 hypothetical protein Z948_1014 [Sulfitobacter donghicola DSW-25 = KCTC 12864 = JCM 14565]